MADNTPAYLTDGTMTFDHGEVRLGNTTLPGILKNLSVRGAVRFDKAKPEGLSGTTKKTKGWEDADITLVLELTTDDESDCYDKLDVLNAVFKAYDADANPKVYGVANAHLRARGVDQVAFSGLESSESDADDVIMCTLTFVEYIPPITKPEKQSAAKGSTAPAPEASGTETATLDPSITVDVD